MGDSGRRSNSKAVCFRTEAERKGKERCKEIERNNKWDKYEYCGLVSRHLGGVVVHAN